MTSLRNLNPEQALELAIEILLEKGFPSTKEFLRDNYEVTEDDYVNYLLQDIHGVWEVLTEEVPHGTEFAGEDGLIARIDGSEYDGHMTDREQTYLVVSLQQGSFVRYIKRSGYYSSYSKYNSLVEGSTAFVKPKPVTVTEWETIND